MKVTQWYLWAVAAALALMVAGCSGSSTKTPAPTPPTTMSVPLPGDNTLVAGELTVAAGQSKTRGGVVFSCPADGDDCVITIVDDLGLLVASATGGNVIAMAESKPPEPIVNELPLPLGHSLGTTGSITVKAGKTVSVAGGVDITCPADGEDCMIEVSTDLGVVSATSTGGEARAVLTPMPVDLPPGSGELVATTLTVPAGGSVDEKGVKFACSGDLACDVIVTVAADGSSSATSTGGTVTATQIPPLGHIATADLGDALRDKEVRGPALKDVWHVHPGKSKVDGQDIEIPSGGMTLSSTTHEATTGDDYTRGINDMTIGVTSTETDLSENPVSIYTGGADGHSSHDDNLMVVRTVSFTTAGSWIVDENEAGEWSVSSENFNNTGANIIWGHSEESTTKQDGGRTVHLDLYSDFDNKKEKPVSKALVGELSMDTLTVEWDDLTYKDKKNNDFTVKTWTFGNTDISNAKDEISIPAGVIHFDDPDFVSPKTGEKQELQPEVPNKEPTVTIMGTWKGIPGSYSCVKATGVRGNCIIRNQQGSVTAGGKFRFRPDPKAMVVARDTDWLAIGVWMTVPDDSTGDYAVGAFVHGSRGTTAEDIGELIGTADYKGEAVGRFAETANDGLMTSGSFSADAELNADFGATANVVSGHLTGFSVKPVMLASGSTEKPDWQINLQDAKLADGRRSLNGGISGYAQGHNLDGFWAGQFFGPSAKAKGDMAQQNPSAIAGTFAASDRDANDDYSLSLIGAFGAAYRAPVVSAPTE